VIRRIVLVLVVFAACKSQHSSDQAPAGSAQPAPPPAADAAVADQMELINAQCRICHTTQYLTQQRLSEPAWKKTIEKMRKFGAQLTDEQAAALVAYAAKTWNPSLPAPTWTPGPPPPGALPGR
jgi:mono/diheme cytochrome c family protein